MGGDFFISVFIEGMYWCEVILILLAYVQVEMFNIWTCKKLSQKKNTFLSSLIWEEPTSKNK